MNGIAVTSSTYDGANLAIDISQGVGVLITSITLKTSGDGGQSFAPVTNGTGTIPSGSYIAGDNINGIIFSGVYLTDSTLWVSALDTNNTEHISSFQLAFPYPNELPVKSVTFSGDQMTVTLSPMSQSYSSYKVTYNKGPSDYYEVTTPNITTNGDIELTGTGSAAIGQTIEIRAYAIVNNIPIGEEITTYNIPEALSGIVIPIKGSSTHYLRIYDMKENGEPLTNATLTLKDSSGQAVPFANSIPSADGIYDVGVLLSPNTTYLLEFSSNTLEFSTAEYFNASIATQNVVNTSANIVVTINTGTYFSNVDLDSNYDLVGILTSKVFKLYNSNGTQVGAAQTITNASSYTFSVTGLTAGTTYSGWYVAFEGSLTSPSITFVGGVVGIVNSFTPTNNSNNGHNNMAALEYNYPSWSASVTQTNTITVLGEDSGALDVDETITVDVPLAKLKEALVYESNWTLATGEAAGDQPLPKVAFRPSETYAAKSELDTMFGLLKAKMDDQPLANRTFDDDADVTHDSFGKRLISNVTFTGSVFDSQELPKVAIRSVEEGDISVEELTTTVASVTTAASAHKAYLEGLFEQLVAADRIKKDDGASANTPAGWTGAKMPSLAVGDSISFKITYNFSKTREYEVDGQDSGNGNTAAKALTLTIGGSTFTIQVGADGSETSDEYSRTYEIKLVAA